MKELEKLAIKLGYDYELSEADINLIQRSAWGGNGIQCLEQFVGFYLVRDK